MRFSHWRGLVSSRGGQALAAFSVFCGAVLVTLVMSASSNSPAFSGVLIWLLAAGMGIVLLLMLLAGYQLLLLRRRLQKRVFGSKLTLRLVLLFALVAMLPGALVYAVSVQFLTKSIDTWFDIRVEKALDGGLSLGRKTLEVMKRDLKEKAVAMALSLADQPKIRQGVAINTFREQAAVHEAALFDLSGKVKVFSSDAKTTLAPRMPTADILQMLRRQQTYSRVLADPDGALLMRVLVPVNMANGELEALQLIQRVPEDISNDAAAVQAVYAEFQELMYSRSGLKRLYGLSLTLALLLALSASLLLGIFFSERLSAPLGVLAEGTRAVSQGDFRERTPVKSYDELRALTGFFNSMTRDLAEAKEISQRYQAELEAAKNSLESILANLTSGVIALEARGHPLWANDSANRILGVNFSEIMAIPLSEWKSIHPKLSYIASTLLEMLSQSDLRFKEREIVYPGVRGELTLLIKLTEVNQTSGRAFIVVFDDITNLLKAQRQVAWGEVARRLAHEIKNPLTPIQLSAERLQQRLHPRLDEVDGELLFRLTKTIVNQVAALKNMVDAFSQYARSPDVNLGEIDMGALTREVLSLYESQQEGVSFSTLQSKQLVLGDPAKLRQVIHNLMVNAKDAVSNLSAPRVSVSVQSNEKSVLLCVQDNGTGFSDDFLSRPIEPYVTTKRKGTGLGLAIVQKIVEEHSGSISFENLKPQGARVTVTLPSLMQRQDRYSRNGVALSE